MTHVTTSVTIIANSGRAGKPPPDAMAKGDKKMTNEQWEELTNMWGNPDEGTLEKVAQMRDSDRLATENYIKEIEERDAKIRELEQSNIEFNRTNMNLIMRLTDPSNAETYDEPSEPEIADINDLDAFIVKED